MKEYFSLVLCGQYVDAKTLHQNLRKDSLLCTQCKKTIIKALVNQTQKYMLSITIKLGLMLERQIDSVFKLQCLSPHQQNKDEKSNDYQNKCKK